MKHLTAIFFVFVLFLISCQREDAAQTVIQLCTSTNPVYIHVTGTDTTRIFVPNIFSPANNGAMDGNNDNFLVFGTGLQSSSLNIFDGNTLIFHSDSMRTGNEEGWDGTINGVEASEKEYQVAFSGVDLSGVPFSINGKVSLIRHFRGEAYSHADIIELYCDSTRFGNQWDGRMFHPLINSNEFIIEDAQHYCK